MYLLKNWFLVESGPLNYSHIHTVNMKSEKLNKEEIVVSMLNKRIPTKYVPKIQCLQLKS